MNDSLTVDVFSAGTWGGMEWTTQDLDEMARNFDRLLPQIRPPLKLGHADQQVLAGQADGQPALGWVSRLYREGSKLKAVLTGIPSKLRDLIEKGRYRRVSAELYPQWESTGAEANLKSGVRGRVLSAVALLGADIPEVKTLDDLHSVLASEHGALVFSEPTWIEETPMDTINFAAEIAWAERDADQLWRLGQREDPADASAFVAGLWGAATQAALGEALQEVAQRHGLDLSRHTDRMDAGRRLLAAEPDWSDDVSFSDKAPAVRERITKAYRAQKRGSEVKSRHPSRRTRQPWPDPSAVPRQRKMEELARDMGISLSTYEERQAVARVLAQTHPDLMPRYGRAGVEADRRTRDALPVVVASEAQRFHEDRRRRQELGEDATHEEATPSRIPPGGFVF